MARTIDSPTGPIEVTGGLLASDKTIANNAAAFLQDNRAAAAKMRDKNKDDDKDPFTSKDKKGW